MLAATIPNVVIHLLLSQGQSLGEDQKNQVDNVLGVAAVSAVCNAQLLSLLLLCLVQACIDRLGLVCSTSARGIF